MARPVVVREGSGENPGLWDAAYDPTRRPYVWFWRKYLGERKNQRCSVLARGRMNSILVEFGDGFRVITSRFAVRLAAQKEREYE